LKEVKILYLNYEQETKDEYTKALQSYQDLVEIKSAQRDEAAAYDNERYIGITVSDLLGLKLRVCFILPTQFTK